MWTASSSDEAPAAIEVCVSDGAAQRFATRFVIGRSVECDVQVAGQQVSRQHAEVVVEQGQWVLRDLGSANGVYQGGEKVKRVALGDEAEVSLGRDGPVLRFTPAREASPRSRSTSEAQAQTVVTPAQRVEPPPASPPPGAPDLDNYIERYFGDTDRPAGEHTRMIRQAYQAVKTEQEEGHRRRLVGIAAVAAIAIVLMGGMLVWQRLSTQRLEAQAAAFFDDTRVLEAEILQVRAVAGLEDDGRLASRLDSLQSLRDQRAARYDGFIEEYGRRRRLDPEEQVILKVARVFNESAFEMPPAFVRSVRTSIRDYWQTPAGQGRFLNSVRRAQNEGYIPVIVETMQRYNLPPEFFYLALVESNFDRNAIGPTTRWGVAKGMWQFIPDTAQHYDLDPGVRANVRVVDSSDDRLDPRQATDAAARYLLDIHSQLAGASSLLAMASYNWGEHRVVPKLEAMLADKGITEAVTERTYWSFYSTYQNRMPEETKNYVALIFAAAVIGENPRLFGFDLDNPLQPYIDGVQG